MKTPLALIRTLAALAALAAQLLGAVPASLLHLAPVSSWFNMEGSSADQGSSLAVAGRYAYLARANGEVLISDISNPTNPVAVSTLTLTTRSGHPKSWFQVSIFF